MAAPPTVRRNKSLDEAASSSKRRLCNEMKSATAYALQLTERSLHLALILNMSWCERAMQYHVCSNQFDYLHGYTRKLMLGCLWQRPINWAADEKQALKRLSRGRR